MDRLEKMFGYYKDMLLIAEVENALAEEYVNPNRVLHSPLHLCRGQEAMAVGVCSNLKKSDVVFSNHRSHGHYLAKGGNLKAMISELYGKHNGCCKGHGGSLHLCDMSAGVGPSSGIVAGNVSVATGYALASHIKGNKDVTCVFLGDGASEEGSVYESICYARIRKIPILYVIENNKYAVHTPFGPREPFESVTEKFSSIIECSFVDGNDVEKVADVSERLVQEIRLGGGPRLLEGLTYRYYAHNGSGDSVGISRTQKELDEWKEKDPIEIIYRKLEKSSLYKEKMDSYKVELKSIISEAFLYAEKSAYPKSSDLMEDFLFN